MKLLIFMHILIAHFWIFLIGITINHLDFDYSFTVDDYLSKRIGTLPLIKYIFLPVVILIGSYQG